MVKIDGFEDYLIAEDGTIWSSISEAKLRPGINTNGYPMVHISDGKKKHAKLVHRLVAETYIPNPDNLPCVLHKDDDKLNPHKDNLMWGTQADNMKDKCLKGRQSHTGRPGVKIEVVTPEGFYLKFDSLKEACASLDWPYKSVATALSTRQGRYKKHRVTRV